MSMQHRLRAPTGNGEVLAEPGFDAIPKLVDENRRKLDRDDVRIGGMPLRELRALARREVLNLVSRDPESTAGSARVHALPAVDSGSRLTNAPLILAGHQPELSHPGVWVKHFSLNGLAKILGGIPLNLIVDNDTLKSPSLRFPVFHARAPASVRLQSVAFDKVDGETYEDRSVFDPEMFRTFADRAAPLWRNWGFEPALRCAWEYVTRFGDLQTNIGGLFAAVRQRYEHGWGCQNLELTVSRLAGTEAFRRYAAHVLHDLGRFREIYNAAIRSYRETNGIRSTNHPAPELAPDEAPFWVRTTLTRRERATPASDVRTLRPRALTLTLFARVCLGDFFIHGIGGGKYDEVTDAIIRNYFGIDPPAYQVLSATLHLPLPGFPSTDDDVKRAERRVRDLMWNPQRHINPENAERPEVQRLLAEKRELTENEPPHDDHAVRREWFRALHRVTERLRPFVWKQIPPAKARLAGIRAEADANAILRRRDYSWVLYPEETLRPFLQQFLEV